MFLNQTAYSTGNGSTPFLVVVIDVNSDNKPDIVVANEGTNNVGVLLNAGNGTFLNQTSYSTGTGSNPYSVAVADVNGDNIPDIVVANQVTNNVGVLINAGNGTFLNQTTYSTGIGSSPRSVTVVDVNSDNKSDIVVANYGLNNVGVLLNAGNGTFLNQTTYSTGNGSEARAVAVVDVNSDNKPDIVVGNYGSNNVGVLFNAGNGTFLNQTTYSTGTGSTPRLAAVVDVNSDNKPDIVVANQGTNNVCVLLNAGNGTFLNQTTYSTGTGSAPRSAAVVDVNSDSQPDIVVANSASTNFGVLLNAGNGTFLNQTTYSTGAGSTPYSAAVVDVNSDNKPDVVVAIQGTNNVGVFLHC
jgi:hypothetical protein